ncbi:CCN family member 1 [Amia ocellicauda]|uniref:CCN family member 1 n=1 Tax=Amia ocellicauda TaxID=2972642 RepID=UPI003463E41D
MFAVPVEWTGMSCLLLLSCALQLVESDCPLQCPPCPSSSPRCPPGVSWVQDGCGCCKVCARQYNQDCSASQPCDHIKGLHCHLGAGGAPERGLCRAQAQGRPCELGGRVYQHGEAFQPSCQHQCSCMDGVVGCLPLCPPQLPPPPQPCSRPRVSRPPGRCCQEWLCNDEDETSNHISEDAPSNPGPHRPHRLDGNEILAPGHTSILHPFPLLPLLPHSHLPPVHNYPEWNSQPQSHVLDPPTCFLQTTDWSECSATCGLGISSRVTNSNAECRLVRETRLCQIRPCDLDLTPQFEKGHQCRRTVRPQEPVRVEFAGCATARRYRPRACGSCQSSGQCCTPSLTRTVRLHFHCPDGESFTRSVMWIQRCHCQKGLGCQGRGGQVGGSPSVSLHNDIHTFSH